MLRDRRQGRSVIHQCHSTVANKMRPTAPASASQAEGIVGGRTKVARHRRPDKGRQLGQVADAWA